MLTEKKLPIHILSVPADRCPLDELADLGKRTKKAWLIFHADAVKRLLETASVTAEGSEYLYTLAWPATEDYPETKISLLYLGNGWLFATKISAEDIAFAVPSKEPQEILLVKLAT